MFCQFCNDAIHLNDNIILYIFYILTMTAKGDVALGKCCDCGKSKTRVCHHQSTGGSILKIRLLKQKMKINITFGKQLGRKPFQSQNKHYLRENSASIVSPSTKGLKTAPELCSLIVNSVSEYHKADTPVCVSWTASL